MTDPKAAAERIVKWIERDALEAPSSFDKDAEAVARAYLSLTDKADDERARGVIRQWDELPPTDDRDYVDQLAPIIAAAFAEVRAQERERAAGIADTRCAAEQIMRDDNRRLGSSEMAMAHGDRAHIAAEIAASIRGGDNG